MSAQLISISGGNMKLQITLLDANNPFFFGESRFELNESDLQCLAESAQGKPVHIGFGEKVEAGNIHRAWVEKNTVKAIIYLDLKASVQFQFDPSAEKTISMNKVELIRNPVISVCSELKPVEAQ